MQGSIFSTAAVFVLAPFFTGCFTVQEGATEPELLEQDSTSFDYIDDRVSQDNELIDSINEGLALDSSDDTFRVGEESAPLPSLHQITLLAGVRDFTDDDIFGRVDSEFAFGLEYAQEISDGLGFEVGGLGSLSTDNGIAGNPDVTGAAAEIYGGARYWFKGDRRWTPYVGAGLSAIMAGVDNDEGGQVADDQDFTLGVYAHGGVQYDMTDALFLSADVRTLLGTDLDLETISGDADYWQFLLGLGFRL